MDFGIKLAADQRLPIHEGVGQLAVAAEEMGYDSVWVADHVVIPRDYTLDDEHAAATDFGLRNWADPFVSLAYVAGQTKRVKLGTAVLVLPLRNPLLVAKSLATLDVLSNGRVILGTGVGWLPEEFDAVGAPDYAKRGAVTDEWLAIYRSCWTDETPSFAGKHYQFKPIHFYPKPKRPIPIWIGGNGPRALRRAGELGDGWHGTRVGPAGIPPAIAKIKEAAIAAGRDPSMLTFSVGLELDILNAGSKPSETGLLAPPDRGLIGTIEEVSQRIADMEAAGIQNIELRFRTTRDISIHTIEPTLEMMQLFATKIMPRFKRG